MWECCQCIISIAVPRNGRRSPWSSSEVRHRNCWTIKHQPSSVTPMLVAQECSRVKVTELLVDDFGILRFVWQCLESRYYLSPLSFLCQACWAFVSLTRACRVFSTVDWNLMTKSSLIRSDLATRSHWFKLRHAQWKLEFVGWQFEVSCSTWYMLQIVPPTWWKSTYWSNLDPTRINHHDQPFLKPSIWPLLIILNESLIMR